MTIQLPIHGIIQGSIVFDAEALDSFGKYLFVGETEVELAWVDFDMVAVPPSRRATPVEITNVGQDNRRSKRDGLQVRLSCGWVPGSEETARWTDVRISEDGTPTVWGNGEWIPAGKAYTVSPTPFAVLESVADLDKLEFGDLPLAVFPEFTKWTFPWPFAAAVPGDEFIAAVHAAINFSPTRSALVFPRAWAAAVKEWLLASEPPLASI